MYYLIKKPLNINTTYYLDKYNTHIPYKQGPLNDCLTITLYKLLITMNIIPVIPDVSGITRLAAAGPIPLWLHKRRLYSGLD